MPQETTQFRDIPSVHSGAADNGNMIPTASSPQNQLEYYEPEPEGFEISEREMTREMDRAQQYDTGKDNTSVQLQTARGIHSVTLTVSEERLGVLRERLNNALENLDISPNPLADNSSIQSVSLTRTVVDGNVTSQASLKSVRGSETLELTGNNEGEVFLTMDGRKIDITAEARSIGINAADIRREQHSIAYDGEVNRVEQQSIMNMISAAKDAYLNF